MHRLSLALGMLLIALASAPAVAQKKPVAAAAPSAPSAQADRSAPLYFYLTDAAGNRILLQTQFSLSNLDADTRVLRRFYGVLAGLEQKGFKKNDKISIGDWDKKEKFAKCYIYLEDEESGRGKGTGARVWCSESGISEVAVAPSEDPKHVDRVLERFGFFLAKAREGLKS
jgi:hypothetical protein